jgi:division protein CdvB (Snf7/Vps24/ESCRT-III family)
MTKMAKYLLIHDSSEALQEEELQELENQYQSNVEAVAALELIEEHNGNLGDTIQEIAEKAGVELSSILQALDNQCRNLLKDKDVSEDLPDLANTIVSGVTVAALLVSHASLAPFAPVLGYCAALAVKKGIKLYTGE